MGIPLTEGQKGSISREAAEFLSKIRTIPLAGLVASYLTTPTRVLNFRVQYEKFKELEESIITKFDLKIKEVKIGGVPVVVIEPPNIKPELQSKIIVNVHGGGFVLGRARDRSALIIAGEIGMRVYSIE